LLSYWGLPNVQMINREVHVAKNTIEAKFRACREAAEQV
jgi:hypothetical protein